MNSRFCLDVPQPVFRCASGVYRADNCMPLVEAVQASQIKMHALARGHYPGQRLKDGALPGLKTVGHWDAATEQNWGLPWHRNEGIEIGYLESGVLDFAVDGEEFTLEPGSLTVTRPWQSHRLGRPCLKPNRLHWLILDVGVRHRHQPWHWPQWLVLSQSDIRELEQKLRNAKTLVWRSPSELRHCFRLISQVVEGECNEAQISHLAVRVNDLFLLLLDLFRSEPLQRERPSGSREKVRLFLASLASDPRNLAFDWTLEHMAESSGLKMTQFVRYTRELTNMAPLHYLNHCRLDYAARLLREEPSATVTGIAFSCGFASSQYFATLFRARFGMAPRDFRIAGIEPELKASLI